jgi:ectoine hydroxylase-related dioxygenase (phytanoyl-CoA dioxygenase family)
MNLLKKYWGTLRRQRLLHIVNNIRWYQQLKRNRALYSTYGVKKSVIAGLSHSDFPSPSAESPWLDTIGNEEKLKNNLEFTRFSPELQGKLLNWSQNGHLVLPGYVSPQVCDQISKELDSAIQNKQVDLDYTNSRVMNFFQQSESVKSLIHSQELMQVLTFILGKKVIPFQTINFTKGSQQNTHSDSIHMTTEPKGYLLAIWVALEDITPDSGPLHYYPGSQKLPYIMSEDFENDNSFFSIGENYYEYYEKKIASLVQEKGLKKEIFLAKKGDLFIWHANLLHGGEKRLSESSTRRSLVAHYFCEGDVINYHEITQRPAIIRT